MERHIEGFELQVYPVSVAEYRHCVEQGVCTEPADSRGACSAANKRTPLDGPTFELAMAEVDAERIPVTCVTGKQASHYCHWVGGRLPTVDEWLAAARGASIERFVGAAPPSCSSHWRIALGSAEACCGTGCDDLSTIGQRAMNGRDGRIGGLLLTQAELVAASTEGRTLGCASESESCIVLSGTPQSIDSIRSWAQGSSSTSSFRCAWGVEK